LIVINRNNIIENLEFGAEEDKDSRTTRETSASEYPNESFTANDYPNESITANDFDLIRIDEDPDSFNKSRSGIDIRLSGAFGTGIKTLCDHLLRETENIRHEESM